jgi:DNA-binding transcriptional regulator YiaG
MQVKIIEDFPTKESAPIMKTPSERLRRLRHILGMSAVSFARLIGVTPATLHNWENAGKTPNLSARARVTLAKFGANPGYIDGIGDITQPGTSIDEMIDCLEVYQANGKGYSTQE